jgi:Na+/melibiose symporter-like transporter
MTVSKDYLVLFLAMVIMGIAAGITTNLTLYFYSYFWEFSPINILTIGLTLFLAPLAGLKLSPFLTESNGQKK